MTTFVPLGSCDNWLDDDGAVRVGAEGVLPAASAGVVNSTLSAKTISALADKIENTLLLDMAQSPLWISCMAIHMTAYENQPQITGRDTGNTSCIRHLCG